MMPSPGLSVPQYLQKYMHRAHRLPKRFGWNGKFVNEENAKRAYM
jgi:hypothetical protein